VEWYEQNTYYVVVLRQQLGIEEEISRRCEFIGHSIEEHLGTVILVLFVRTLLALDSRQTEPQHVDAIAQEHGFTTCVR
jgi:hypothetical protein